MAINPFLDLELAPPKGVNGQVDPTLARIRAEAEADRDDAPSARRSTVTNPITSVESIHTRFDVTRIPLRRLRQMRRDPMIAFGLFFILAHLLSARWRMESTNARAAAFCDAALREIYADFVAMYLEKLTYGYQAAVKRFDAVKPDWTYVDVTDPAGPKEVKVWDEGSINAIVWRTFTGIPPESAFPAWAEDGSFNGIVYRPSAANLASGLWAVGSDEPTYDVAHAIWLSNDKQSVHGNLYGYPRIGPAYRPWWSFWFTHGLLDRHFEQDADPSVKVWFPSNKSYNGVSSREIAKQVGDKVRSGNTIVLPSELADTNDGRTTTMREWDVEFLKGGGNFGVFKERFDQLQVFILRACMVPEDAFVAKGSASGYSSTSRLQDAFQMSQSVLSQDLDYVINHYLIPQLLQLNGFDGVTVRKCTYGLNPADAIIGQTLLQGAANANDSQLNVDYGQLMEMFGIPVLSATAVAAKRQQVIEQAKLQPPPPTQANSGTGTAGVNQRGQYFDARERIVLSSDNPFVLQLQQQREEAVAA